MACPTRKGNLPVLNHSMEIEAPYYEKRPPQSHQSIFVKSSTQTEGEYTRKVLKNFMEQAFRQGKLAASMDKQVKRMVQDPRVMQMVHSFAHEWLRIDRLENMDADVKMYPQFNRFVKQDMADETYHFMKYLLQDRNILEMIDADFAMLNKNLAVFYGINGVEGSHFQRVALPTNSNRGGLLFGR